MTFRIVLLWPRWVISWYDEDLIRIFCFLQPPFVVLRCISSWVRSFVFLLRKHADLVAKFPSHRAT
ncbi:hypothetical protein A2U01_0095778, partial [Trifolium medium]|nr:hypothetical protein [Trifolium medium]